MSAAIHPQLDQMQFFENYVNTNHPAPINSYDPLIVRLPQKKDINPFVKTGRQFEAECVFLPILGQDDKWHWVYSDCRIFEYVDHPFNRKKK